MPSVECGAARSNHHRGADDEWKKQLQSGDVERESRHGEQHIPGVDPWALAHRDQEVRQRAVRDFHTFRPAGGSGRVDDIGKIGSERCRLGINLAGWTPLSVVSIQLNHRCGPLREAVRQRRFRDDGPRRGVFQDQVEASLREMGIERNVCRACLPDGQQRNQHLNGALHADRDEIAPAGSGLAQVRGQ